MSRQHEGIFSDYDPQELSQPADLTFTQRELVLIRMGLGLLLRETSRHDHIYNDLHTLLAKLPPAPARVGRSTDANNEAVAPDRWLKGSTS